jgi:hypothetical protein
MEKISFDTVAEYISLLSAAGVDAASFREMFVQSGLMADFAEAVALRLLPDREEFRRVLGLSPLQLTFAAASGDIGSLMEAAGLEFCGNYGVSQGVLHKFSSSTVAHEGVLEGELVEYPRTEHERCWFEILLREYRPATIHELLGFAREFPYEQWLRPIVATGSEATFRNERFHPALVSVRRDWVHVCRGDTERYRAMSVVRVGHPDQVTLLLIKKM